MNVSVDRDYLWALLKKLTAIEHSARDLKTEVAGLLRASAPSTDKPTHPVDLPDLPTGEQIKNAREYLGITQADLAQVAEVHRSTISNIESDAISAKIKQRAATNQRAHLGSVLKGLILAERD